MWVWLAGETEGSLDGFDEGGDLVGACAGLQDTSLLLLLVSFPFVLRLLGRGREGEREEERERRREEGERERERERGRRGVFEAKNCCKCVYT